MATAKGWAVIDEAGNINVRTVSEHRRAAIVNWLFTVANVHVMRWMSDAFIEDLWKAKRKANTVVEVTVHTET